MGPDSVNLVCKGICCYGKGRTYSQLFVLGTIDKTSYRNSSLVQFKNQVKGGRRTLKASRNVISVPIAAGLRKSNDPLGCRLM